MSTFDSTPLPPAILVADDDADMRDLTETCLRRYGYRVVGAGDGATALMLVTERAFDLYIVDMLMPNASGFQVVHTVRALRGDAVPVVMVSGNVAAEHQEYATWVGATRFLPKPFSADDLLGVVGELAPLPD